MPREPEDAEQRVTGFIKPVGVLLTERADVLAKVYASAISSGRGDQEQRIRHAREAVNDFLLMLDGLPSETVEYNFC
jgi:hypothetical protein